MSENISFVQILRRGWWIILLTALVAGGVAWVVTSRSPREYRSDSRYIVGPNTDLVQDTDLLRSLDTLDRGTIIATYSEIFGSQRIISAALNELQLSGQFGKDYTVTSFGLPQTNILVVSVSGPNPNTVVKLNKSVADQGLAYIQSLNQVYSLTLLDEAQSPVAPISPAPLRNTSLAVVLGLGLGAVLAFLRLSFGATARPVFAEDEGVVVAPAPEI